MAISAALQPAGGTVLVLLVLLQLPCQLQAYMCEQQDAEC
jgi:hypothetical protein